MPARSPTNMELCVQHNIDYEAVLNYYSKMSYYKGVRRGTPTEFEIAEARRFRAARYLHDKAHQGTMTHKQRNTRSRSLESSYQYKVKHGLTHTITEEERAAHTEYFRQMKIRNPSVNEQLRKAAREHLRRVREDPIAGPLMQKRQNERERNARKKLKEEQNSRQAVLDQNSER